MLSVFHRIRAVSCSLSKARGVKRCVRPPHFHCDRRRGLHTEWGVGEADTGRENPPRRGQTLEARAFGEGLVY